MEITLNRATCPDGGILQECYKDEGWGQVNLRTLPPGAKTPPHRHPQTNELWFLVRGVLRLVQGEQGRPTSEHVIYSGQQIVIPAGLGHSIENIGGVEAVVVYKRDTMYDPEHPDKAPWDPAPGYCGIPAGSAGH